MKVLIIEDEIPAAKRLEKLLKELNPQIRFLENLQEVETAINWFNNNEHPDLVFMDIQLADGYSFEIFEKVTIDSAVIFATAYDQFAIKAFKVNGMDYLLKPINKQDLADSLARFNQLKSKKAIDLSTIQHLFSQQKQSFKDRFLVKSGEQLNYVKVQEIAYFVSEGSYSFLVSKIGNRFILDDSLDLIEGSVNPENFFRVSRKKIISIDAIDSIHNHFNNRLKINLAPADTEETIVSRPRVKDFKSWLDQ